MAWINGQWVDEQQGFGGMLGGFGGQPRFAAGYTGDTSLDHIGTNLGPPPGRGGGVGDPTPQNPFQQPIYGQGPQMQPPFAGGLGNIDQWNPVQPGIAAQYQPPMSPLPQGLPPLPPQNIFGPDTVAQPPRPPVMQPPVPPQVRPPMPPPTPPPFFPDLTGDLIFDPPPDWRPRTDHEFNVAQREKTKRNLATDRAKTKKHYAKLRAQGASPQTIAKAKAKSKARSKKIKGQSLRRHTIKN